MAISGKNLPVVIFLTELDIQCSVAKKAYEMLKLGARGWIPPYKDERASPLEIILYCSAFLSASAMISKILFESKRKNSEIISRCKALRKLINVIDLPNVNIVAVRNSFEHTDERLDLYLKSIGGKKVAPISVSGNVDATDTLWLKCFNPKNLTVSFADDLIEIKPCMEEIESLKILVDKSFKKLGMDHIKLWGT